MVGLHNCSGTVKFTYICLQAQKTREVVASENSHFSSLLAAGDVLRGGNKMQNVPSGNERGETAVFIGYKLPSTSIFSRDNG